MPIYRDERPRVSQGGGSEGFRGRGPVMSQGTPWTRHVKKMGDTNYLWDKLGGGPGQRFPGFYSGVQGTGQDVTLDPRFALSGNEQGQQSFQELLDQARDPYRANMAARDSALDNYDRSSASRMATALGQAASAGRGLRGIDQARAMDAGETGQIIGRQSVRDAFNTASANAAVSDAQRQQDLLGKLPALGIGANLQESKNADQLLKELQARAGYDQKSYAAQLKESMGIEQEKLSRGY